MTAQLHRCDNCDSLFTDETLPKTLDQVRDLEQRLDPGSEVPSGECDCGALTYHWSAASSPGHSK